jgi:hypothetical protein
MPRLASQLRAPRPRWRYASQKRPLHQYFFLSFPIIAAATIPRRCLGSSLCSNLCFRSNHCPLVFGLIKPAARSQRSGPPRVCKPDPLSEPVSLPEAVLNINSGVQYVAEARVLFRRSTANIKRASSPLSRCSSISTSPISWSTSASCVHSAFFSLSGVC